MRKNIIALLGLAFVATQVGGCVVYERPHPYYYHYGYYYR